MVKHPGRDSDDDAAAAPDANAVSAALQVYESKLAALLRSLEELTGIDKTTANQARAAEIAAEIRRINAEMNQLRERTGHWHVREGEVDSSAARARRNAEAEKLKLRRKLGGIADEQVALVAKWNLNPIESEKRAFEDDYRRLAHAHSMVLAELQALQQKIDSM
jgi:hypothetical protein